MNKIIIGNWKMNGTREGAVALSREIARFSADIRSECEIVVCPPFTLLEIVGKTLQGSFIQLGAQDCHAQEEGAHTGSISAAMLKDAGCSYVIIGHSERRQLGEANEQVKSKATIALKTGLIPIICIGETLAEREAGRAKEVVLEQIAGSIPHFPSPIPHFLLAYEPVWAIGASRTPTLYDIAEIHNAIASEYAGVKIVYGGSVNAANARDIMGVDGVAGVLVGGASLKAEEFCGIIAKAE